MKKTIFALALLVPSFALSQQTFRLGGSFDPTRPTFVDLVPVGVTSQAYLFRAGPFAPGLGMIGLFLGANEWSPGEVATNWWLGYNTAGEAGVGVPTWHLGMESNYYVAGQNIYEGYVEFNDRLVSSWDVRPISWNVVAGARTSSVTLDVNVFRILGNNQQVEFEVSNGVNIFDNPIISNGSPGLSTVITITTCSGDCTLTFSGGILTATTCSHT